MRAKRTSEQTEKLVFAAAMTALVILLQVIATVTRVFLGLSINLSLIPIVIGAATGGIALGAWLGLVSGTAVLITGEAAPFLAISIFGALFLVLSKGVLSGVASAVIYKIFKKTREKLALYMAAITCPIVNTGVYLVVCTAIFKQVIEDMGRAENVNAADVYPWFIGVVLFLFAIEFISTIVLTPYVLKLLEIKKKK